MSQSVLVSQVFANPLPVISPNTVSRGKAFNLIEKDERCLTRFVSKGVNLFLGNSLDHYNRFQTPHVIVSDGAYGILGFHGDTAAYQDLPQWYEPHIKAWTQAATPATTLWFWNSEIGWATIHPVLEKYGWKYVNCNIWNKGKGHIAGNVNTAKIRRFPVVSEVCVQYVFDAKINGISLQKWLISEWKRTKLPMRLANQACGVVDAATRKYFDKGHLWYFPPPEMFLKISNYANQYGQSTGKPYFSSDGINPITGEEWSKMRAKFKCPHGYTNVWERNSLRGEERVKVPNDSMKSAHLNQKPLDLMRLIIESSSDENDLVWEPFGGLFSASLAALSLGRRAYACELDKDYFQLGVQRFCGLNQRR